MKTEGIYPNELSLMASYSPDLLMTVCDNHGHRMSNGSVYRNSISGYGFLSTAFLFGTGKVDLEDDGIYDYTAYGFEQTFNPLLAPMYVDEIRFNAVTYNDYGPIPAGKSIKAYIIALDEEGDAKETLATFEATSADTLDFKDNDEYNGQRGYYGTLVYKNTDTFTNSFGNKTSLPAAIPAGVPFRIQFEGMDEEGVSVGAYALFKSEVEDTYIENGYLLTKEGRAFTFANPLCANVGLLGQYEVIDVQTKDFLSAESLEDFPTADFQGWNILHVSADGQSVSTEGLVGNENYDMGGAFVGTSTLWFDANGLANYDIDKKKVPSWLEGIQVDTTYYSSDGLTGYNIVIPKCKPLPAGVNFRSCEIDIYGRAGIPGNNKIVIIQGEGGDYVMQSYLAISQDGKTATFYHDNLKDKRPGMVFDLNGYEGLGADTAAMVTKVVFDPSFAEVRPTSTYKWFYGMSKLASIEGMEYLNTSVVTTMRAMFSECSSLTNIGLSHFDTSNVTTMRNMFNGCNSLTTIDVSHFDTSNVTDMYRMFYGCSDLASLDMSNFDTSNVTTMYYMFYKCSDLASLDMSNFDTSNVTTMEHIFSYCSSLASLDVSKFNTSNVTSMQGMFNLCNSLETIDVSGFNTSKVKRMRYMFNECTSLKTLDLSNFDTSKASDTRTMLDNDHSLELLAISGTMGNLNDNACNGVGTESAPCRITAPEGFDFGDVNVHDTFQWKGGWFNLGYAGSCALTADAATIRAGERADLSVGLSIDGEGLYNGYQFDVTLPDGMTLTKENRQYVYTLADDRYTDGMLVNFNELGDGKWRVMVYSLNNALLTGLEGDVITLSITASEDVADGDYPGSISNFRLSRIDNKTVSVPAVTFDIKVVNFAKGDANHDGVVDISDVMLTVYKALLKPVANFHMEEANTNRDGEIDIVDVMGIVNIMLGKTVSYLPSHYREDHFTQLLVKEDVEGNTLSLEGGSGFIGMQMVVTLPEGSVLRNASLGSRCTSQSIRYKSIGDNRYNVVVWSTDESSFGIVDDFIKLDTSGRKGIVISDIRFTDDMFETIIHTGQDGTPTCITSISGEGTDVPLYNLQGMKVNNPQKGVYIKDNKKMIVK